MKNITRNTNTGNKNTGDWNTGDLNTGKFNTGNKNTGDFNMGNRNTGCLNTGDRNTGDWNTGCRNTGYSNTGDWNTGNRNMGNLNTGDWNTGDFNTGNLNTTPPPLRIFNKETKIKREDIEYPSFFFYALTEWISEEEMSDKEKEAYPSYVTTGGYLKCYTYLTAWRNSWNKASDKDREKCFDLPNWDNEVFKKISGIDVEKELKKEVEELTIEQVCKELGRTIKIVK